jgi:hypothetical protein
VSVSVASIAWQAGCSNILTSRKLCGSRFPLDCNISLASLSLDHRVSAASGRRTQYRVCVAEDGERNCTSARGSQGWEPDTPGRKLQVRVTAELHPRQGRHRRPGGAKCRGTSLPSHGYGCDREPGTQQWPVGVHPHRRPRVPGRSLGALGKKRAAGFGAEKTRRKSQSAKTSR